MCSHGYLYRGNEKQTCTILKNINFVLLQTSHSLKVPYTSLISYWVPNLAYPNFNLRRGANSKRGAYLKLGANSSIYGFFTLPLFYSEDFGNRIKLRMDRCAFLPLVSLQTASILLVFFKVRGVAPRRGGDSYLKAWRKFKIKPLRETNVTIWLKQRSRHFFYGNPKQYLNGQI